MSAQCRATVVDCGPTLSRHWDNDLCVLGQPLTQRAGAQSKSLHLVLPRLAAAGLPGCLGRLTTIMPELSVGLLGRITDQALPGLPALGRLTTIYRNCQYLDPLRTKYCRNCQHLDALLPYTGIVSTWTPYGPSTGGTVSTWVSYGIHVYLRNRIISCGNYW